MEQGQSNRRVWAIAQFSFCCLFHFQQFSSSAVIVYTFSAWSWMRLRLEKTNKASLIINWQKCRVKEHSKTKGARQLTTLNYYSSLITQTTTTSVSFVLSSSVIRYFILADMNAYANLVDKSSCNSPVKKYALCVETELKTLLKFIDEVI